MTLIGVALALLPDPLLASRLQAGTGLRNPGDCLWSCCGRCARKTSRSWSHGSGVVLSGALSHLGASLRWRRSLMVGPSVGGCEAPCPIAGRGYRGRTRGSWAKERAADRNPQPAYSSLLLMYRLLRRAHVALARRRSIRWYLCRCDPFRPRPGRKTRAHAVLTTGCAGSPQRHAMPGHVLSSRPEPSTPRRCPRW